MDGQLTSNKRLRVFVLLAVLGMPMMSASATEDALTDRQLRVRIKNAMRDGTAWLRNQQSPDGSWGATATAYNQYRIGLTSLAVLAMINCDVPIDAEPVKRGLEFLRSRPPGEPEFVYEASLYVMALCAAGPQDGDMARIGRMTRRIIATQCTAKDSGPSSGLWGYHLADRGGNPGGNGEDRSNGQFAVLALRDAAQAGIDVDRRVWERTQEHWLNAQLPSGAWGYKGSEPARGSMTTAGLSTLVVTMRMLQDDRDVDNAGRPDCCTAHPPADAFEKGRQWLASNFTVYANPGEPGHHYYYLYGLERAARLGHVRFFGNHDWYREGATYLQEAQSGDGSWRGRLHSPAIVSTPFALLFLSKGLSRIVVNKLDYSSPPDKEDVGGDWNRHPLDVTNLIEKVDGLEHWPPRLNSQVLTLSRLEEETAVIDLNQAPVLFVSGREALPLTDTHVKWLREYVDEGGFIFASANCESENFDSSFRETITRMFPQGEASLKRLGTDHPIFRSENNLTGLEGIELYGVDFGCRTSIVYSPTDLGCYWQKWMKHAPKQRHNNLSLRVIRATNIGVNVLAYATGREPPVKLGGDDSKRKASDSKVDRNSLEIAQLRYRGNWDIAPKALKNLLEGLNETTGMNAATNRSSIPITLGELKRFPLVYMHGRYRFQLTQTEQDSLRDYLNRGAVLFADACCGSSRFDQGFRELMGQLYPDHKLKEIPADHELYSETIGGHKIESVRLRRLIPGEVDASIQSRTESIPPLLEGIEIDGRYAVIYSKYDISCALENQASLACDGYEEADAMRLGVNIVLYSMLQDISAPKQHSKALLRRPNALRVRTPRPLLPEDTWR